jgi:hypothetical protein
MAAGDGSERQARVTSNGGCKGDGNSKGLRARTGRALGEGDRRGRRLRATVTGDGRGKKRGRQVRVTARAMGGSMGNGR